MGPATQKTVPFRGVNVAGTVVPNDPSVVGALVNVTAGGGSTVPTFVVSPR